ncbi:phage tail tape measure protein [Sphingobacterium multivorum]|uniref:phage tail tape measure protein n=1 Tax=Sphingobacterium multivorum TaxID=28454 RepID=UPI003DA41D10
MADLRYKVVVDDDEAKRKISELLKGSGVSASGIGDGSGDAKKSTTAVRQLTDEQKKLKAAQLENIESIRRLREERSKEISDLNVLKQLEQDAKTVLAEKKAAAQGLITTEKELNIQYKQGQIELQAYNKELKQQAEERRKVNAEERAAEKVLRDAEKARKDAEREAEKQRKAAEKRRKELEKENSAYYQLNKALNNVRKESKDVLAEMFKLEGEGKKTSAAYQELANKARGLVAQTQYLDKGIKKIDASLGLHQRNVGNYAAALDNIIPIVGRVNSQLAMFGTSIDELAGKPGIFKEIGAGIAGAFKNLVAFVSTPIGAAVATIGGLFALFQANKDTVIQFDDGLKSVSKTTGLSGKALQQYSDDIIQLSRALKTVESKQLLEYSQVAGQLGVKGRDNLLAFSEALAKLETASDIRGEEGATKIARLLTLTDGGVQNVKEFGDEIVNLGNNFAATESEILTNAEAIGQNVGLYKIGRKDVLAYATATKAVGLEAEVVGSTFSRTLGQFEKMTRSGKGAADLLKIIGGTQADLQKRFKTDASGVFMDYIRGLNKINQAGGSVNEALERTGIIAVRDQRVIASLASTGYDTLTNAMNTAKNASGAMQAEFETGASKLVNQIKRINIAWDNLVLSIENGSGAIGKTSVAIIGYVADMLEAFNKIADSANIFEGVFRYISTGFKMTIPGRAVDWATGGGFDKVSNWIFPNDSKKASEDNSKFFAEFSQKTRAEQLKMIANQEELIKKQNSLNKAFANPVLEENLKKMRSLLKTDVDTSKIDFGASDKDKRKSERAAEQLRQATERQRSLQLEIDKINEKASRNQLSRDESEVASVKDKYAKIKEEVRKFYADPKNKGLRVDMGGLQRSENFEVAEATTRQDTKLLTESLTVQKQLLDEYNAYAEQTSIEEADKRYSGQLASFKGYKERLQKEYMDLITLETTSASGDFQGSSVKLTQAQEERAKALRLLLDALDKEERDRTNKRFVDALKLASDYDAQLIEVQKKYQQALIDLGADATEERKAQLKKGLLEETSAIVSANIRQKVEWDKTFSTLQFMSKKATDSVLDDIQKRVDAEFKAGKLTKQEYDQMSREIGDAKTNNNISKSWIASTGALDRYRDSVKKYGKDSIEAKQAQSEMFTALADDLAKAQHIVGLLGDSLSQLGIGGDGLQNTVNQIGNLVGGMGELAAGIASGNPISIISGSIKTLTSALVLFNTKDKKLQKQIDAYKTQLDSLGKAYDTLQRRISNSVGENYYTDSDKAIVNLKQQQRLLADMAKVESEKKKSDKDKVKSYYDEIDSINKQIEDIQKSITENLVQTTFKDLSASLADALVTAFEAGESAVDSLDETFDKFIKNALVNSLKLKMIEPIVNDMVNQLADYMKSNNNTLTGFNFSVWKDKIDGAGTEFTKTLEEAYKQLGLSRDGFGGSGLKGSIQREVTEATQSENNGLLRSQTELLKRSFDESKSQGVTMGKQLAVAMDQLTALNAIQVNTGETVKRLDTAVSELQSINKSLGGRF